MTMPTHRCAATHCRSICNRRYLMCSRHWKQLPRELQQEVCETAAGRNEMHVDESWAPWWRAQARAVHFVARLEGKPNADAVLERDLAFADQLEHGELDELPNAVPAGYPAVVLKVRG